MTITYNFSGEDKLTVFTYMNEFNRRFLSIYLDDTDCKTTCRIAGDIQYLDNMHDTIRKIITEIHTYSKENNIPDWILECTKKELIKWEIGMADCE